jgi:NADH:ubiquinone oxidoreductase subunit F (NADH-binding)
VIELMSGRSNLPVTTWKPPAVAGYRGRPTLLSNAETWAQIGRLVLCGTAAYCIFGSPQEPGTTLLTVATTDGLPRVVEAAFGTPLREILDPAALEYPLLVGGFHGSWATASTVEQATVSVDHMSELGVPLGAGVLLTTHGEECPVELTSRIVDHLAGQSARRCGPCFNGLPALATSLRAVREGSGGVERLHELSGMLARRGACAHPDGTIRLVKSLLSAFPEDVAWHAAGRPERCGLRLAS